MESVTESLDIFDSNHSAFIVIYHQAYYGLVLQMERSTMSSNNFMFQF